MRQRLLDVLEALARTPRPLLRTRGGDLPMWSGWLTVAVVGFAITRPLWGPQPPSGADVMGHLLRADFGLAELAAHGRLDGWFPRLMVGHQEFLFYGPGYTWFLGLIRAFTFGLLSNDGALKIGSVLTLIGLPIAVSYTARGFGMSKRAASIAAVLALGVTTAIGFGVEGMYRTGLYPQQLGAALAFLFLGGLLHLVTTPSVPAFAATALGLGGVLIVHPFTAVVLAALTPFCLAARLIKGGVRIPGVAAGAAACVTGVCLVGFWVVPFVAHRSLAGPTTAWATAPFSDRLLYVWSGRMAVGPVLVKLAGVAVAVVLLGVLFGRWRWIGLVAAPFAFLYAAHWLHANADPSPITLQLANRGLGFAAVLALFPLAIVLAALSQAYGRPGHAAALWLAATLVMTSLAPFLWVVRQHPEPGPTMIAAAEQLRRLVPDGARFAMQRSYRTESVSLGMPQPFLWLTRASGRDSLNVWGLESSIAAYAGFAPHYFFEKTPDASADTLIRYGVSHVVTVTADIEEKLASSPRFGLVWRQHPIAILEVRTRPGQRFTAPQMTGSSGVVHASVSRAEVEHFTIEVDTDRDQLVTAAIGWSPKWRATVDGRPVPVIRTPDGIIGVELKAGRRIVDLRFGPDGWDRLGWALSLTTIAACATAYMYIRQRRKGGANSPPELHPPADPTPQKADLASRDSAQDTARETIAIRTPA
jgi:hypothetical protein